MIVPQNRRTGLYGFGSSQPGTALTVEQCRYINLWHQQLANTNWKLLKTLNLAAASEFQKLKCNIRELHPCLLGKAKKNSFDSHFKRGWVPWLDCLLEFLLQNDKEHQQKTLLLHAYKSAFSLHPYDWNLNQKRSGGPGKIIQNSAPCYKIPIKMGGNVSY